MNKGNTEKKFNFYQVTFFGFLFIMLFLWGCYLYISLSPSVFGKNMKEFAASRQTYSSTLKANRGTIYDSDSEILALNVYSYTVIAYLSPSRTTNLAKPMHVVDVAATAKALAPILDMDVDALVKLMSQDKLYQVELGPGGRDITELKKEEIEKLKLPGIDFIESSKRFYPNGDFASYITGYAKSNEYKDSETGELKSIIEGELGIESKYNDVLKGTDGFIKYQQDKSGYKIPETKEEKIDPVNGSDIYLTINSAIQRFLQDAISEADEKYDYDWLQIHVMDARTGDILASSSSPSFDPNIRNITNYENSLTSILYEPGSVMKTYTYMCAIDKGTYQGDKRFDSGHIKVGDAIINDWNRYGWGNITYDYGFEQSSNVGITNILLNENFIDKNDLKACYNKFGFGQTTGIELPREYKGSIEFNYPLEVATAGFGQGIFTTPIQQLQALTIISNNGKMLTPHIVKKIVDSNTNKIVYERKVTESDELVKQSTVNKIKDLMWNVVNDYGSSGSGYKVSSIDLIGKTGTAQIYENGAYLANQYIRSFAGMFPKDNPKIIIYGAVKKAIPDVTAALTLPMKRIVENVTKYLSLSNNSENELKQYNIDNYTNTNANSTKDVLESLKLKPIIIGDGEYIINQYPKQDTKLLEGDKVFLLTNGSNYIMPNMNKWSRSDVNNYFGLIKIPYEIVGNGYVTSQSKNASEAINKDETIILNLEGKYQ